MHALDRVLDHHSNDALESGDLKFACYLLHCSLCQRFLLYIDSTVSPPLSIMLRAMLSADHQVVTKPGLPARQNSPRLQSVHIIYVALADHH